MFIVVGVASAAATAACGKVAFVVTVVVIVICQLIARCSAQRTAQSTKRLSYAGSVCGFNLSGSQPVSLLSSINSLALFWLYLALFSL